MNRIAAPSWGFGMGGGSALNVANNSQFRANNPGMASFAQTLGGGQQQSSLDLSYVHTLDLLIHHLGPHIPSYPIASFSV